MLVEQIWTGNALALQQREEGGHGGRRLSGELHHRSPLGVGGHIGFVVAPAPLGLMLVP